MRYNSDCDRGINIDEIAAQCRNAILRADARRQEQELYAQVLEFARWEDDLLIAA